MHPNTFIKSHWRLETRDTVFVAMSFDDKYKSRFYNIYKPAIEGEPIHGFSLAAYRVDTSQSGDSILSEISDGISHSRIILADVSAIDEGRYTGKVIRNANVMYEVGMALTCRLPSEVLLLRDDNKPIIFDLSAIPHKTIDFNDIPTAISEVRHAISDRISETKTHHDARLKLAIVTMTADEIRVLKYLSNLHDNESKPLDMPGYTFENFDDSNGIKLLLQKGLIRAKAIQEETGTVFYGITPFGRDATNVLSTYLAKVPANFGK